VPRGSESVRGVSSSQKPSGDGKVADAERSGLNSGGVLPLSADLSGLSFPLRVATLAAVAACLALALVHVLMVFLHVAPPNTVSKKYGEQINGWVYPVFEQNWRLFAPNPQSVNERISVRTMRTDRDGKTHVSDWFDLTAVDVSAIRHSPFPSHTAQNMLRRAWAAYADSHRNGDHSYSQGALMVREYLKNIAVQRVAAHRGGTFESIQLRVTTVAIAPPGAPQQPQPAGTTRYLPWWKVVSDGR